MTVLDFKLRMLLAATLACCSTSAFSQLSPSMVANSGLMISFPQASSMMSRHLEDGLTVAPGALTATHWQPPPRLSPAALQSLSFQPSPAVSQAVARNFVETLSEQHPQRRAAIANVFDSGVLSTTFSRLLAKFGYSPDNLADVMTAYLILSWETVHNGDATRFPQGIDVVHQRMRYALAGNPQLATFSDAQKQQFAETLADLAMLSTIARKELLAKGDTRQLQQLEDAVRQTTTRLGVDVGSLQLTNQGFIAAN